MPSCPSLDGHDPSRRQPRPAPPVRGQGWHRVTREYDVIVRTAFVSTYPPRRCGIASFTHDLAAASGEREIAALLTPEPGTPYPLEVHHRIRQDEPGDYLRVARALARCVDVVSIQHEYGIWGGDDGESVIDFVRALDLPAVATLHTVLREPTDRQRAIMRELVDRVQGIVVMSRAAADLLATEYGVDRRRVEIIPHGVPDLPLVASSTIKPGLGLDGRQVILSFGLLGPGKGYELAIDALPAVVAKHPDALYVILGATHPDLVRREGEAYRSRLVERTRDLGVQGHVQLIDRFVGRVELTRWLEAADVFVTPYPNLDQIVSGTLSYAMGAGRAIVSTPYTYARELLSDGRGVLVEGASPPKLAEALNTVLGDDALRADLGHRAYDHARQMVWSEVGGQYARVFRRVAGEPRAITPLARPSVDAARRAAVNV
jgi:glycosyltransferase involved in cell wall biosynthesis